MSSGRTTRDSRAAELQLPTEPTQARRFRQTRSAQSAALHEDYVELIADLLATSGEARPTDVARRFGVSHVTAIKTISRLKREGLATGRPYRGIFLTDEGHKLATRVKARHRLVVDVLLTIGVPHSSTALKHSSGDRSFFRMCAGYWIFPQPAHARLQRKSGSSISTSG